MCSTSGPRYLPNNCKLIHLSVTQLCVILRLIESIGSRASSNALGAMYACTVLHCLCRFVLFMSRASLTLITVDDVSSIHLQIRS